jgi:hypothetical protein
MFNKKKKINKVLIRACIGCVLPYNAELIGSGDYDLIMIGKGKTMEKYYDYIINEDDLDDFLQFNQNLLIKYKLLDIEVKENKDDKNPVKETTLRGWSKKNYD